MTGRRSSLAGRLLVPIAMAAALGLLLGLAVGWRRHVTVLDLLLAAAVGTWGLVVTGWAGLRLVVTPVRRLAETCARVVDGSTSPSELTFVTSDELVALARSFAAIAAAVEERQVEVGSALDELRAAERSKANILAQLESLNQEQLLAAAPALHDDVIQIMTSLGYRLGMLRRSLPASEAQVVEALEADTRMAVDRLRLLLFDLTPAAPDDSALVEAIRSLADGSSSLQGSMRCVVDDRLRSEPRAIVRGLLLGAAREALANVRNHSGATEVTVVLREVAGGYLLRVADDGVGCDGAAALLPRPGHLGLPHLKHRVEQHGGWLRLDADAGGGTVLDVWVPSAPVPFIGDGAAPPPLTRFREYVAGGDGARPIDGGGDTLDLDALRSTT